MMYKVGYNVHCSLSLKRLDPWLRWCAMIVGSSGALRYECFAGVERRLRLGRREKCVVPEQHRGKGLAWRAAIGDWCDLGAFMALIEGWQGCTSAG